MKQYWHYRSLENGLNMRVFFLQLLQSRGYFKIIYFPFDLFVVLVSMATEILDIVHRHLVAKDCTLTYCIVTVLVIPDSVDSVPVSKPNGHKFYWNPSKDPDHRVSFFFLACAGSERPKRQRWHRRKHHRILGDSLESLPRRFTGVPRHWMRLVWTLMASDGIWWHLMAKGWSFGQHDVTWCNMTNMAGSKWPDIGFCH